LIATPARGVFAPSPDSVPARPQPSVRQKYGVVGWLLVLCLLGAILWAATANSPAAQKVQEFVGCSHSQTIVDGAFSLDPRSFASYEFTVPIGAVSISLAGEFSAGPSKLHRGFNNHDNGKDGEADIEVYVLTDAAYAVWSRGYSTQTQYESGPEPQGEISATLPTGAEVYRLVFDNKKSLRGKDVHASVLLRYKNWVPDEVVRLKNRFLNYIRG